MRLHFPNTSRVKKAAKHLAGLLSVPLSSTQRAIARACGYRDWHDFERQVATGPACALDQSLTSELFIERQKGLILSIASDLQTFDGDVQYALSKARLTGDRAPEIEEQIAIRLACWRATTLPVVGARQRGAIGTLRTADCNGEAIILRTFGRPTETVSHQAITTIADFEYVSPRTALDIFLPMRLYLPYGYWTEADGARVIFSRDYKPLWRLRAGQAPERVDPWDRISFKGSAHLWDDARTPWRSAGLRASLIAFLKENGLNQLPILADALPLLVHERTRHNLDMADGAELLRTHRTPAAAA